MDPTCSTWQYQGLNPAPSAVKSYALLKLSPPFHIQHMAKAINLVQGGSMSMYQVCHIAKCCIGGEGFKKSNLYRICLFRDYGP